MELKYIITKDNDFAIFSFTSNHNEVARGLQGIPVGAGFCDFAVGYKMNPKAEERRMINVHCWGESLSLHIKSREEDEKIINKILNDNL